MAKDARITALKRVEKATEITGWKPSRLAKEAGIAVSTLTRFLYRNPGYTLSLPTLAKIDEAVKRYIHAFPDATEKIRLTIEYEGSSDLSAARGEVADLGAGFVPVVNTVEAGDWSEIVEDYRSDEYLTADTSVSSTAFALEIRGTSMEPEFHDGDRIIIAPVVSPRPGDFVVAKLESDAEATFKKYRLAGMGKNGDPIIELVPLNNDWPTLRINEENPGRIVGTMLEHRRYRSR